MFCTKCGSERREKDKFCPECGVPTGISPIQGPSPVARLSRPTNDRKIAGVCAGIARYLQIDVTAIRIVALILLFWPVPFVASIAYLAAWFVIPPGPLEWRQPRGRTVQTV